MPRRQAPKRSRKASGSGVTIRSGSLRLPSRFEERRDLVGAAYAELAKDGGTVGFGRAKRDFESLGDFAVREFLREELCNFRFALGIKAALV